jgi:hypothetical protein
MVKKKRTLMEKRLVAYSAAAAGMLAVAPAADAAIHYSGLKNIVIDSKNPTVLIDLNSDGKNDFRFALSTSYSYSYVYLSLAQSGLSVIEENVNHLPANLPSAYLIKNNLNNPFYWSSSASSSTLAGKTKGNFGGKRGYLGVKFNTAGGIRYGWIQFDATSWPTQGVIVDWAYEDTGAPVAAGSKADPPAIPAAIPAADPWGLLILITLLASASVKMLKKEQREG